MNDYASKGISICIIILAACACEENEDMTAPTVISTSPINGSTDVNPALGKISVTFSEAMKDGNWSWAYDDPDSFPAITGEPYFVDDNATNILPVRLEEDKEYVIWINSAHFNNFKDQSGNSSVPYRLSFRTAPDTR